MGWCKHEAAAADPVRQVIHLTEDETDGRFHRFGPTTWGNLSPSALQVLAAGSGTSGSSGGGITYCVTGPFRT